MKKLIPILLATGLMSGCISYYTDEYYDDPYESRYYPDYYYDFRHQLPYFFSYGCSGYYGPYGNCVYHRAPYAVRPPEEPGEGPLIPADQPRVMVMGDEFRSLIDGQTRSIYERPDIDVNASWGDRRDESRANRTQRQRNAIPYYPRPTNRPNRVKERRTTYSPAATRSSGSRVTPTRSDPAPRSAPRPSTQRSAPAPRSAPRSTSSRPTRER